MASGSLTRSPAVSEMLLAETDTEVAEKLGVSRPVVHRVCKNIDANIITHDRVKARRYYDENPDASYREVARQVDSAKATVGRFS